MFLNNKIKYVFVIVIGLTVFNLSAEANQQVPGKTDWYFAVRTNLNSAAIITGIAATWHALCYSGLPVAKSCAQYASGTIDRQTMLKELKGIARTQFSRSLFLAGLAVAIEGVNKLYFKPKDYGKIAS